MGSGSFGGGSGSFGGGGSGGGSGEAGGGTDSARERILKLAKLTDAVNANPAITQVRKKIYEMLQDRTRSAFLRATLTDDMVVSAYQSLLSIEADLRGGAALGTSISKIGGSAAHTLADLTDVICRRGQTATTDERVERIVRRAVRDLLMKTVRNGHDLFYETPVRNLGVKFDRNPLATTADTFLGALIAGSIRADLLELNAEARAVLGDASHEIGVSWTDSRIEVGRRA
jgi:hypothetical protein